MTFSREFEMRVPIKKWLESQGYTPIVEFWLTYAGQLDVLGVKFFDRRGRNIPRLESVIAIELKMDDVAGVIKQAENYVDFADRSYAAMPIDRIKKMRRETLEKFMRVGVGLLSVGDEVEVVIDAKKERGDVRNPGYDWRRRQMWRRIQQWNKKLVESGSDANS